MEEHRHIVTAAMRRGILPGCACTPELESWAVGWVLAKARLTLPEPPLKEHERNARRLVRKNPTDPDALMQLYGAQRRRRRVVVHPDRTDITEFPQDNTRKADPLRTFMLHRLVLIWQWREGALPMKTLRTGFETPQPGDPFFPWASDIMARQFHPATVTPSGLLKAYRKLDTNGFIFR